MARGFFTVSDRERLRAPDHRRDEEDVMARKKNKQAQKDKKAQKDEKAKKAQPAKRSPAGD